MNPAAATAARNAFRSGLIFLVLFETLSFCGQVIPIFSEIGFAVIIALALIFAFIRPELTALMLLAELFVGSQGGYLFAIGAASGTYLSLRMGLFLIVFGAWLTRTLIALLARTRGQNDAAGLEWFAAMRRSGLLWPYLVLLGVFGWGFLRGLLAGNNFGDIFFDANAYAYFALFPAFFGIFARRETVWQATGLLAAAVTTSTAKALFVLFVFSHRMFYTAPSVYVWIRDTRVGEITRMVGDFYRVFFQSDVFVLVATFALALGLAYAAAWNGRRVVAGFALFVWALTGIVMGLSRSFWFGLFCGGLALVGLLAWGRAPRVIWRRLLGLAGLAVVGSTLVIAAVYSVPFPRKGEAVSFASLLSERAFSLSGEAAANSRWALLPELWRAGWRHPLLGSGLGTTVTYQTSDPRLLADLPTAEYTTYAFEWGYHDLWIKFGLLGLAAYGWLIWRLARLWWRELAADRAALAEAPGGGERQKKAALAAGVLAGLAALVATNVFSPYFNHPLGIGIFMILGAVGYRGLTGYFAPETAPSDKSLASTLPTKS